MSDLNTVKNAELSLYNDSGIVTIYAKQNDTARSVRFKIIDNHKSFKIPVEDPDFHIYIKERFPDNTTLLPVEVNSANITDGAVIVHFNAEMLAQAGVCKCELVMIRSTSESIFDELGNMKDSSAQILSTASFNLNVEANVNAARNMAGISRKRDMDITEAVLRLDNLSRSEDEREASELQRIAAEGQRISAELSREANEANRVAAETLRSQEYAEIASRIEALTAQAERLNESFSKIENAAAKTLNGTIYIGATATTDGTSGLMPVAKAGEQDYALFGDGKYRKIDLDEAKNATTVNGHTVESNVPKNAKFTDTTYGLATDTKNGLLSSNSYKDIQKLSNLILHSQNLDIIGISDGLIAAHAPKNYSKGECFIFECNENYYLGIAKKNIPQDTTLDLGYDSWQYFDNVNITSVLGCILKRLLTKEKETPFRFGVENGEYGYYNDRGSFIPF